MSGRSTGAEPTVQTTAPAEARTNWSTFQHDHRRTGYADGTTGPVTDVTERWRFQFDSSLGSPVVRGGTVYAGDESGTLYAVDASSGEAVWSVQTDGVIRSAPAAVRGCVYVTTRNGTLYAFDAADGSQLWRFTTPRSIENFPAALSSPAVVGGTVFFGSVNGRLYAVDALDGAEHWHTDTGAAIYSSPAVRDGTVYIANTDGTVYAVDAVSGEIHWETTLEAGMRIGSSPAISDGTVYIGGYDGFVYALESADGAVRWTYDAGAPVVSSPAIAEGTVVVGSLASSKGTVHAIDAAEGVPEWTVDTGDDVLPSPAITSDTVYLGDDNSVLTAFDLADGTRRWHFETGGDDSVFDEIVGSPAVANHTLFITDSSSPDRGYIHAIRETDIGLGDEPTEIDSCTDITEPGTYELTADVPQVMPSYPRTTCINITASNVVLDGQDHRISTVYDYPITTVGINVSAPGTLTNVSIKNIELVNWTSAIRYENVSDGVLQRDTIAFEDARSYGISLVHSDHIAIRENTIDLIKEGHAGITTWESASLVVANNSISGGVDLSRTPDALVRDNVMYQKMSLYGGNYTVTNNTVQGMYITGNGNTISNNTIHAFTDAYLDNGIGLEGNDSRIVGNSIVDYGGEGIVLDSPVSLTWKAQNNTVAHNTVVNASYGLKTTGSGIANTTIEHNTIRNNTFGGLSLRAPSLDSTIRENTISQNGKPTVSGGVGLIVRAGTVDLAVINNTISGNRVHGIGISESPDTTLRGNTLRNNGGDGIVLFNSSSATIQHNTVTDNGRYGVYLFGTESDRAAISDNTIQRNQIGVLLQHFASKNTVSENLVTDNSKYGIVLQDNSNGTHIATNVVTRNGWLVILGGGGILLTGSSGHNTLRNNTVYNNSNWEVSLREGATNNDVANLDIGSSTNSNTTLSYTGNNVSIIANASAPPNPDATGIGRYFEAERATADAVLHVSLQYADQDVTGVSETNVTLWRYNGSEWTPVTGATVDTAANTVNATITDFSSRLGNSPLFGIFPASDGYQSVETKLAGDDGDVDISDLQRAFRYWTSGRAVPGTNGGRVDTSTLQEFVFRLLAGGIAGS